MSNRKAFLFDLNGTMIDDMQYHIKAWHRILNDLGAAISLEQMKLRQMRPSSIAMQVVKQDGFPMVSLTQRLRLAPISLPLACSSNRPSWQWPKVIAKSNLA